MSVQESSRVSVTWARGAYPDSPPFNPDTAYPEYPGEVGPPDSNPAYEAVRSALFELELDRENFGSPEWNPLGQIIRPGDRVVVKPNLVTHEYRRSCGIDGDVFSVISHPSVVRAVADYAALALRGHGSLDIADNPSIDADFEALLEVTQLKTLEAVYPAHFGINCAVRDLRPQRTDDLAYYGYKSKTVAQDGDPLGSTVLDLGRSSFFNGINPLLFRGVFTNRWETIRNHFGSRHRYSVSNTILDADVYISVPKLKTHHKVGATLNIKGLVGINSNKNHLIHWRVGFPKTGGDEFPSPPKAIDYFVVGLRHALIDILPEGATLWLRRKLKGTSMEVLLEEVRGISFRAYRGAWSGNDTCWRMAADLYNLLILDDAGHRTPDARPLRTFSVVDGIIAGEGNGPFCPTARKSQVVIAGENLLDVDAVAARLMDFDTSKIRYIKRLMAAQNKSLRDITVKFADNVGGGFFEPENQYLEFIPPSGWEELCLHREETGKP